jgi:hypothetical protein
MITTTSTQPDLSLVKARQHQTCASGDYTTIASRIGRVSQLLTEGADLHAGWRVLNVGNSRRTAAEMAPVTRPDGRIALASWTPEGFIGQMFGVVSRYVAPPAGVASPLLSEPSSTWRTCCVRTSRRRTRPSGSAPSGSARRSRTSRASVAGTDRRLKAFEA